ncbi:hypothetical protein EDD86DRAFT_212648 [Gorgonomyces haynaldii]|nr:hypothetical protein EDD86DRAFT_212648 [Gorgonomyces haynaldii]
MSVVPYLLGNVFNNDVYRFKDTDHIPTAVAFVLSLIGLIPSILSTVALLKGSKKELGYSLVISLSIANLQVILIGSSITIANILNGGQTGGKAVCILEYIIVLWGCYCSILSLTALAILRYIRIVWERRPSFKSEMGITSAVYLTTIGVVMFPMYTGHMDDLIRLQTGKIVCSIRASPEDNPWAWFMIMLTMILLGLALGSTAYSYTKIILKFMSVKKNIHEVQEEATEPDLGQHTISSRKTIKKKVANSFVSEQEKALFRKTLALTISFLVCWGPYLFLFLYEIIGGRLVSFWYDGFATNMGLLNCVIEPYLTLSFNAQARKMVFGWVGIELKDIKTDSGPSKSTNSKGNHLASSH